MPHCRLVDSAEGVDLGQQVALGLRGRLVLVVQVLHHQEHLEHLVHLVGLYGCRLLRHELVDQTHHLLLVQAWLGLVAVGGAHGQSVDFLALTLEQVRVGRLFGEGLGVVDVGEVVGKLPVANHVVGVQLRVFVVGDLVFIEQVLLLQLLLLVIEVACEAESEQRDGSKYGQDDPSAGGFLFDHLVLFHQVRVPEILLELQHELLDLFFSLQLLLRRPLVDLRLRARRGSVDRCFIEGSGAVEGSSVVEGSGVVGSQLILRKGLIALRSLVGGRLGLGRVVSVSGVCGWLWFRFGDRVRV